MDSPYRERNLQIVCCREWGMTLRGIGELYDLSVERTRQIIAITGRRERQRQKREALAAEFRSWLADRIGGGTDDDPNIPPDYAPAFTGADLVRALNATLPLIQRAAVKASRQSRAVLDIRAKHGVDNRAAWTILILQREHQRQLAQEAEQRRHEWLWRPSKPPLTQAELRELAKGLHWTEVIYAAGTDTIVRLERRRW